MKATLYHWYSTKGSALKLEQKIKEILPTDIRQNETTVPMTPKSSIVVKFLKNCFFLTWN